MDNRYAPFTRFLALRRQRTLLRTLPPSTPPLLDFSHNDYLGLSEHPLMMDAAQKALHRVGGRSSRLIGTTGAQLTSLEAHIAQCLHTQSALTFTSGYQANVSVLSALLDQQIHGQPALVFSDKCNHASMLAACQMANAKLVRFRHNDLDHLQFLMKKHQSTQPKFILAESLYSMHGDIPDIPQLIRLAKDANALLYFDEAHAVGILGEKGYGLAPDYDGEVDVVMGTFSKALGCQGAYVAGSHTLKRYLVNRASGFIYSTAPSPLQVALMHAAWQAIPDFHHPRQQLLQRANSLCSELNKLGFNTGLSQSHIIPVILSCPKKTLEAQKTLREKGIEVGAIRPPSVPPLQSRLRIGLSVLHQEEDIQSLLKALSCAL